LAKATVSLIEQSTQGLSQLLTLVMPAKAQGDQQFQGLSGTQRDSTVYSVVCMKRERFNTKSRQCHTKFTLSYQHTYAPSNYSNPSCTVTLVLVVTRDAPKFGLGRTSAEYSAEGFGSVRFGYASTFGRTSAELRYYSV